MSSAAQLAMMDPQGRVPPAQTVYSDLLGVSYPARKRQVEFSCSNGDSFDTSGKNTCEIPLAVGTGEWLDLSNSYFKITINNKTTGKRIAYKFPHDIIERLQILGTNSEMIEDVQQYNVLARMLQLHQLGDDALTYNTSLGEVQKSTLQKDFVGLDIKADITVAPLPPTVADALNKVTGSHQVAGMGSHHGQLNNVARAANTGFGVIKATESLQICFPLISGITSTNKYLPVGMLKNRSLSLRITLARAVKAYVCEDDTDMVVDYSNIAFVADVITMAETYNEKFQNMLRSIGDISIHYTTYKNYQDSTSATATEYNGLIPDSSRSLKSIFTVFNKQAEANETDALMLRNPSVSKYQYTILSETYPQSDVSNMSATNRNQAFANLHIALGQLGSISSRCAGNADSYYTPGNNDLCYDRSTTFALGVCCESHNKSSNLLESGISLQNSTQPCRLTASLTPKTGGLDAMNVNHFTLSDRLLMIDADGNLRSSG